MNKGVSDAELFDTFEKAEVSEVKRIAREHTKEALNTLVKLMRGQKTPAGVKRQCAKDILDQGWGRPDGRGDGGDTGQGGLTINIMKLSTGVVEQVAANNPELEAVRQAVDVAGFIEEHMEET